jgi:hypothetical protein
VTVITIDPAGDCPDSPPASIHGLVLDDEPPILKIWGRIPSHSRYRVSPFSSPSKALQLGRIEEVDVAVGESLAIRTATIEKIARHPWPSNVREPPCQ